MNTRKLYVGTLIAALTSIGAAQAADTSLNTDVLAYQVYQHTLDAANPAPISATASGSTAQLNTDVLAYQLYQHTLDSGNAVSTDQAHSSGTAPALAEHTPLTAFRNIELR